MPAPKIATNIEIGICGDPKCNAIHIQLYLGDELCAQAAVHAKYIPSMVDRLRQLAYTIVTREGYNEKDSTS